MRAGQQAPFAWQMCSVLLSRKKAPLETPLGFTCCVDLHRTKEFPPRPRFPLEFTLCEDQCPDLADEMIENAMCVMDEGYLVQGYKQKRKISAG